MKGNGKVIEALQDVLTSELTAINQYFIHAEMCADWGFAKLAAAMKQDSIEEMKHAELSIERILYLQGAPNMSKYMTINIGSSVEDMFKNDLKLEYDAVAHLNKTITVAMEADDNGTRDLFMQILKDEEMHVDWIETQLNLIERLGSQNYLAQQS